MATGHPGTPAPRQPELGARRARSRHRARSGPAAGKRYSCVVAMSRMTEQIGRVLGGRYRLLSPLGSGASAQVYLADDVRLRRRVAVKVLHPGPGRRRVVPAPLPGRGAGGRRPQPPAHRSPSTTGAATTTRRTSSPSTWAAAACARCSTRGHRLTPAQALVVGLEAARALDHAHRQGFVHRDIKPANLLFGADARLRVADFGLARAIAEAGWTEPTGAVLGTARYASPEQARGEPVDGRSDVYSLALVLVEAVTGTVPFTADTTIGTLMARLDHPMRRPRRAGPARRRSSWRAGRLDRDRAHRRRRLGPGPGGGGQPSCRARRRSR